MNAKEHSLLLYLLDGIKSNPKKANLLLKMARENNSSNEYQNYLIQLEKSQNILQTIDFIRNQIN